MPSPVILLVFANDRIGHDAAYLDLPEEKRIIEDVLDPATDAGVRLVIESNAVPERLFDRLDAHNDAIVGLHFGGHATGAGLTLEDRAGAPQPLLAAGMAQRIGRLPNLRWVCLNGCGTAPQVQAIHAHGPVPVVATSTAIRDDAALRFARRFYSGLAGAHLPARPSPSSGFRAHLPENGSPSRPHMRRSPHGTPRHPADSGHTCPLDPRRPAASGHTCPRTARRPDPI